MKRIVPKPGTGRSQWNTVGWFGALLGSTAYLLVGVLLLRSQAAVLAIVWLVCFVLAVTIGTIIWSRRSSIAPYPAIQLLILTVGGASTVAIATAYFVHPDLFTSAGLSPNQGLAILLIVPGLMLLAHFWEGTKH